TRWAAASTATRRTRSGSCPISRRCCTTTRASWRITFMRGSSPATRDTARRPKGSSPGPTRSSRTARAAATTPAKTRTSAWMTMAAALDAAVAFGRDDVRAFALKSLDRIVAEMWSNEDGMWHASGHGVRKVRGLLEDHVYVVDALLTAYGATANPGYLRTAEE